MTIASGRSSASSDVSGLRSTAGLALRLAVAAALAACAVLGAAVAIEEEDIAGQLVEFRDLLEAGRASLNDLEFADAIEKYTTLIDAYKTGRIPMVSPDAREVVGKAFEGRALALANLGRNAEASADFESLVRFDPTYAVDVSGISPKIISLYTEVRRSTLGSLSVETDPLGAEVTINDQSLGPAPVTDRQVVKGPYSLRVSRPGFDPVEEEILVEAGGKVEKRYRLAPNARSMRITTVPRDVKVLVDGEERGVTFGIAGSEYQDVAREMKLSLTDISEPLLIENLPPGDHEVLLRKECYQDVVVPVTIVVDPNDNAPLAYKPFRLDPSRGTLEVGSRPSGARVLLDGEEVAETPATIPDICSGRHDLLLEKEGLGRSTATVEIRRAETTRVEEQLKLSLAAIDLREGAGTEGSLGAALRDLGRYNVLGEREIRPDMIERVRLDLAGTDGQGLSEATLQALRDGLKVELVALVAGTGSLGESTDFLLFGPLHPVPDRWVLEAAGVTGFGRVREALESPTSLESAWSGLNLMDVRGKAHPVVLAVTPGGPAENAGIRPGDRIVSLSGQPVRSTSEFLDLVDGLSPGTESGYVLESDGGTREVSVRHLSTPILLPIKQDGILYNKAIADLLQAAATRSGTRDGSYSWLNIGIALMHFGQWDRALKDALSRVDLPEGAGISRGTARYLSGVCYENLGLSGQARAAYEEAAGSPDATLGSNDGPRLAASARLRSARLGSSQ